MINVRRLLTTKTTKTTQADRIDKRKKQIFKVGDLVTAVVDNLPIKKGEEFQIIRIINPCKSKSGSQKCPMLILNLESYRYTEFPASYFVLSSYWKSVIDAYNIKVSPESTEPRQLLVNPKTIS